MKLQLRGEAFNVFNIQNLETPSAVTINSSDVNRVARMPEGSPHWPREQHQGSCSLESGSCFKQERIIDQVFGLFRKGTVPSCAADKVLYQTGRLVRLAVFFAK